MTSNPNKINDYKSIGKNSGIRNLRYILALAGILTIYNACEQKDTSIKTSGSQTISTNIQRTQRKDSTKIFEELNNPTAEMSIDEIMSLSDEEIINIITRIENNREKEFDHEDKNGQYTIINGKKVYLCDDNSLPKHNGAYIWFEFNRTGYFSLFTKKGKKYHGIYYTDRDRKEGKKIYKGGLTFNSDTEFGIRVNGK